jgi:hypothetical protein
LFLEGHKPKRLAREYAVIHQRIYAIRKMVMEAVADYELPAGYSQVTLTGPAELVRAMADLFEQQMRELVDPGERPPRLDNPQPGTGRQLEASPSPTTRSA